MGCCQSNLSTSTNPHDRKKFIDHIKQSSLDSNQKSHLINNQPPQLEKIPQSSQSYQYSKHGISKCEQFEDSQVSIFEQQRKRLQERSRKRLHVEIHPDVIEKENRREIEQLLRQSELINGDGSNKTNKKGSIIPIQQQLLLSNIKVNDKVQNSNKRRRFNEQDVKYQQQQSQLMSNFQQSMLKRQIMQNEMNSNENFEREINNNQDNEINNSQTDRELRQLHGQLNTMIILWEKLGNGTKRLKVEQMNTQRSNDKNNNNNNNNNNNKNNKNNKNQLQQSININNKGVQHQNQHQQPSKNNQNDKTDKELQNIWNNNNQQQNKQQQKINQPNQKNIFNNYQKQSPILTTKDYNQLNQKQQQENKSNKLNIFQKKPNNNINNFDINDHLPITTNQKPIKLNLQPITPHKNTFQDLSLKSSSQEHNSLHQQQYSKCLLSNPTKILNDSLIDQNNQQKQLFYFGTNNHHQLSSQNYLLKWIETDRKAYQIKTQDILSLFNHNQKLQNRSQQTKITNTLLALICVIKGYRELNRVNLIAFRTMTSTSIFFQSQTSKIPKKSGFKIFYNGMKRLYPFEQTFDGTQIFFQLQKMFFKLYSWQKNSSQLLYNLTGWIPETIMVNEISSYQGVFQRLNSNFIEGNTVITFTGRNGQTWGLKSIGIQKKQIELYSKQKQTKKIASLKSIQQFQHIFKWSEYINMITEINVNWNPLIYDYVWRTENVFYFDQIEWHKKDSISQFDKEYMQSKSHQYLLKIPPSQDDIQVRVFMQVHYRDQSQAHNREQNQAHYRQQDQQKNKQEDQYNFLVIQLHDYTGSRINSSNSAIRKVQKNKNVFSDVFIFQSSKQKNQYVLAVRPLNYSKQIKNRSQIKYTISAFTFLQVSLQQIPVTRVLQQKVISTYLQQSHCGYGINSPHFLNNFYLQLKIPPLQKIKIFVSMPVEDCKFELNLIANPDGQENLTRLNLQNILADIITSQQFQQGKGYLQIETKYEQYFFMITNHTKCKGQFNIIIQVIDNIPKYLTLKKVQEIKSNIKFIDKQLPSLIYSKQKFFYQQPIFTKQFKWLPTHTGPRKRLKSNTHSGYQPFTAFKQFFKNPFIDYKVQKYKKLQFSVYSKSYKQYFDSLQQEQQKSQSQPPTISLTILKVKRPNQIISTSQKNISNESMFKIIVDDAFYVPFGFGFWTKILQIQAGQYRFVFPKMQKEIGQGVFNVYHITK